MVHAYWLIGREIVEEEQAGEARAEYGERLIAAFSKRLTARYGMGFSMTNLQYFRQFYLIYRGDSQTLVTQWVTNAALTFPGRTTAY